MNKKQVEQRKLACLGLLLLLGLSAFAVLNVGRVQGTTIFSDGFDSGNFNAWSGSFSNGGSMSVGSSITHHDTYGASATIPTAGTFYTFQYKDITASSTLYYRTYARFNSLDSVDGRTASLVGIYQGSGTTFNKIASIGARRVSGTWRWAMDYLSSGTTISNDYNTTLIVSIGEWYCLEMYVSISASGQARLYIDGSQTISKTGLDNDGYGSANRVAIGKSYFTTYTVSSGIAYFDCVVVADTYIGPEFQNWLSGFQYRKSHVINSASGAGTNYQVKIKTEYETGTDSGDTVYLNNHAQSDFDDVRFTDDDKTTLLNYWLETKVDSDYAIFWVKIADDLSSVSCTIYVYYGNSEVSTISNGANTFVEFDDFSSQASRWDWSYVAGTGYNYAPETVDGYVCAMHGITDGSTSGAYSDSSIHDSSVMVSESTNLRLIGRMKYNYPDDIATYQGTHGFGYWSAGDATELAWFWWASEESVDAFEGFRIAVKRSDSVVYNTRLYGYNLTAWHTEEIRLSTGKTAFYFNSTLVGSVANRPLTMYELQAGWIDNYQINTVPPNTYLNVDYDQYCYLDWILRTKITDPEPTHGSWTPEEEVETSLPSFSLSGTNSTIISLPTLFYTKAEANSGNLSKYIFGCNVTGSWQNDTTTAFTSGQTVAWVNITKTLPADVGKRVEWQVWANNTVDKWGTTGLQSLITTTYSVTITVYSPISQNYEATSFLVNMTASSGGGLSIDKKWFNVKNGTQWVYPQNQTYTVPITKTGYVPGTYTFYGWANNTQGTIGSKTVTFYLGIEGFYAVSGYWSDIQDAIDEAEVEGGGIVYIPAGEWNFVNPQESWSGARVVIPPGIPISIFGASTEKYANGSVIEWTTILKMPWAVPGKPTWFSVGVLGEPACYSQVNNVSFRFSDIKMIGWRYYSQGSTASSIGLYIQSYINFRVDHSNFQDLCWNAILIGMYQGTPGGQYATTTASGVIDHSRFVNSYGDPGAASYEARTLDYGIGMRRWACRLWDSTITNIWGKYTTYSIYIEDNYFSKWRHSVCSNDGFHYVFRNNIIDGDYGYGSIDGHGSYAGSANPEAVGTRCNEVYNNVFRNPDRRWWNNPTAYFHRGGSAIVTNNTFIGYVESVEIANDVGNFAPYSPKSHVSQTYIWNNILNGAVVQQTSNNVEGVHYFLRAPNLAQDGFTYTPYTYPHPLVEYQSPPQYPPTYSNVGVNSTIAGNPTKFYVKWQQSGGATLHGFIVGTNNTGTWQNQSWVDWAGTPTTAWSNLTVTLNSNVGYRVEFQAWANSSDGLWETTGIFFLTTSAGDVVIEINQISISTMRVNVGSTVYISFHSRFNTNQSSCTTGTLYVNATSYSINGTGWATVSASFATAIRKAYTVTGVDVNGETDYQQIPSNPQVTWDRWEFVSITVDDTRISVGGVFELRYKIRYDYDDVVLGSTKGSVSGFTWDSANQWWKKTLIGSNNVANTNYDETYVTITDQWGLTAKQDVAGVNVVTDKARIYYQTLDDSRVNVGTSIQFRVKALLLFDDHPLGAEDTVVANIGTLVWSSGDSWFQGLKSQSSVSDYTFQGASILEATYGIIAFETNVTNPKGIWDKLFVTLSASETNPMVNETVTISWVIRRQYDSSLVTSFVIDISRDSLLWKVGLSNNSVTDAMNATGNHAYNVHSSSVSDGTYGLTVFDSVGVSVDWGDWLNWSPTVQTVWFVLLPTIVLVGVGLLFIRKEGEWSNLNEILQVAVVFIVCASVFAIILTVFYGV